MWTLICRFELKTLSISYQHQVEFIPWRTLTYCCNPSFGLATKAKGLAKVRAKRKEAREPRQEEVQESRQVEARESHHILPGV